MGSCNYNGDVDLVTDRYVIVYVRYVIVYLRYVSDDCRG